eukprot:scaffold133306_cov98-Phaeocystis_antarctica.AAC.3
MLERRAALHLFPVDQVLQGELLLLDGLSGLLYEGLELLEVRLGHAGLSAPLPDHRVLRPAQGEEIKVIRLRG